MCGDITLNCEMENGKFRFQCQQSGRRYDVIVVHAVRLRSNQSRETMVGGVGEGARTHVQIWVLLLIDV